VPLAIDGQAEPQPPQLLASVVVSTQALPQRMKGAVHWKSQAPPLHTDLPLLGAVQTFPHIPQLDVALEVSTHDPLQLLDVPQSVPQVPDLQTMPAPHLIEQSPQCSASELKSIQAPLQSLYPVLHCASQPELPQVAKPLSGLLQTLPQAPQLAVSASNLTQALPHAV
jgi:hypothetical protein